MAPLTAPILTIAIPTYNRSAFLKRSLQYLYEQKNDLANVELIISDNASADNTSEVVAEFQSLGLNIRYIRNPENKGADLNIVQCYTSAKGKYVLTLGDDDYFVANAVGKIVKMLSAGDYGVVYINSNNSAERANTSTTELSYTTYDRPVEFVKKVNYYITFISGNIVNRANLDEENLLKYVNSNVVQVAYILDSIFKAPTNAYINDVLLIAEPDNSGGYNLFKIFGENFNNVISGLRIRAEEVARVKKIINNKLLASFFPQYILKLKLNKKHAFVDANPVTMLKPLYAGYTKFWLFCYPIYILPNTLAKIYSYFIKVCIKLKLA
jgi:abequosyltransferase